MALSLDRIVDRCNNVYHSTDSLTHIRINVYMLHINMLCTLYIGDTTIQSTQIDVTTKRTSCLSSA